MLILTRNANDTRAAKRRIRVVLPDGRHGWVEIFEAKYGLARLGFEFPRDVVISREELLGDGGDPVA